MNVTALLDLHRAICNLDEVAIRRLSPRGSVPEDDRIFWLGVHKARFELDMATPEQREESLRWLHANNSRPYSDPFAEENER